jgi:hypothetical protein
MSSAIDLGGCRSARLMHMYRERQQALDEEKKQRRLRVEPGLPVDGKPSPSRSPKKAGQPLSPKRPARRCSSPVQCFVKSDPKHLSVHDLVAASLELRMI